MKIVHAFTGSVASILDHKFSKAYEKAGHDVRYVATSNTKDFLNDGMVVETDEDEKRIYLEEKRVLHIDLAKWADALVVAPCSANTLAKIANGFADNLVTCVCRAWDFKKPFLVAPSMNPVMYSHPVTEMHLNIIDEWGVWSVEPAFKKMFCGDVGKGAMAPIDQIMTKLRRNLLLKNDNYQ